MNFFKKSGPAIRPLFSGFASMARTPQAGAPGTAPAASSSSAAFFCGRALHRLPIPLPTRKAGFSGGRRYYSVDGYQVQHFRPRGAYRSFENARAVLLVVVAGSTAVLTIYYGNLETVPYTMRTYFVLLSPRVERQLGEAEFEELKAQLRGKILPPTHPESIRVRLISKDIVQALYRGIRQHERVWRDPEYASGETTAAAAQGSVDAWCVMGWDEEERRRVEQRWSRKDQMLDDKWVQKSRKAGAVRGLRPSTEHLEDLNWEVVVVRNPVANAMCLPGGKIVVFTGLLDHFRSDAEIATVIGHEVGHTVARHAAEAITKNMWLVVLQLILYQFFALPELISAMSTLLLRLPFSRRMEMEAYYIGLLLLAAAGYDPRVAPKVYEKLGQITGDSMLKDYLSTHPSSKKRAELLSQAEVMGEALAIYQEAIIGHAVLGFI